MLIARLLVALVAGYLLGAIPVGVLIGTLYKGVDIRKYGSGRTGATNVLRTLGPGAALCVLVGDVGKGALALLVAQWLLQGHPGTYEYAAEAIAGLAAIVGHTWSVFIRFGGGRGVLVAAGAMIVLFPAALPFCAIGAAIAIALFRFVSVGSIVAVLIAAILLVAFVVAGVTPRPYGAFAIFGAAFIILQHRDNIERLRSGTERKLGQRAAVQPPHGAV